MLDVKTWLESTGMSISEERFKSPPPFPYIVFSDDTRVTGADNKNCIAYRSLSIELYSEKVNHEAEEKIETLLNAKAFEYKRNRTWVDSEKFFQTVYDFDFTEKL